MWVGCSVVRHTLFFSKTEASFSRARKRVELLHAEVKILSYTLAFVLCACVHVVSHLRACWNGEGPVLDLRCPWG